MAVSKTTSPSYISLELEWMENKVKQLQEAVDSYDLANLKDRLDFKETAKGGVIKTVIASKEDQLKAVAFIMEKLPKMLSSLDELRAKHEATKIETRANTSMNGMLSSALNQTK